MPGDEPHVSRLIRTPHATVSIRGTLEEVDRVYRLCSHALLDNGYGLTPPSDSPWANYPEPVEENTDHLRRRLNDVEHQLADSQDHDNLQSVRRALLEVTLDRDTYKSGFDVTDTACTTALKALSDQALPDSMRIAIAIEALSL